MLLIRPMVLWCAGVSRNSEDFFFRTINTDFNDKKSKKYKMKGIYYNRNSTEEFCDGRK